MPPGLLPKTLSACAEGLGFGVFSSQEICADFLRRVDALDTRIGAFISLDREDILRQAAASDARRAAGEARGPLDGVPVAIKDNIAVQGQPCSCASRILEGFRSPYDSTAAARLKAAGAVLFGRTNMDEFAMGSSTENSALGKTCNPWDASRVPGGSSGGSAAAVAALMAPAALGSDTGGSIRQPASFCGVVGLKPTYGAVSRHGLVAFASSLDQIGPIARTAADAEILFRAIAGHDPSDATSLPGPRVEAALRTLDPCKGLKGMKIGLPREYFEVEGLSEDVRSAMDRAIAAIESMGAEITTVSLPRTSAAVAAYYVLATAEASANLARFDGVRYGRREPGDDLLGTYLRTRAKGFGDEVKRRILLGTFVLSSGYYDAYYLRAQKARTLIRRDFEAALRACDAILAPTAPTTAFRLGEMSDPLHMYLADIYTVSVNLAGVCAVSVPSELSAAGLPVGVQFIGPACGEGRILHIAKAFELVRPTREFIPPMAAAGLTPSILP